jgi:RNA polymerase sigma-70 factor (ECF subfamily)
MARAADVTTGALQGSNDGREDTTETQLIGRAQQGDEQAFAALFELHKRRVYSLCLRMTRSAADAEELSQEALLLFFRKLPTFRGESTLATWLHRMVVNVVLMHLRKKCLSQVPLDEAETPSVQPKRQYGAPDRRLAGCILRVSLERAITNLPSGYRSIFILHDIHGYEHAEIAELIGCTPGNSKSQLHKARLKLRRLLCAAEAKAVAVLKTADRRESSASRSLLMVPAANAQT